MARKSKNGGVEVADLQEAMTRNQVPEPEPGNETAPDARARRGVRPAPDQNASADEKAVYLESGRGAQPKKRGRARTEDVATPRPPKLQDLPNMTGPGVGQVEDAELEAIGDEMDDLVTKKRKLAEKITAVDTKAQERMATLGIKSYRYSDREIYLKEGKDHVKTRVIKADQNGEHEENGE